MPVPVLPDPEDNCIVHDLTGHSAVQQRPREYDTAVRLLPPGGLALSACPAAHLSGAAQGGRGSCGARGTRDPAGVQSPPCLPVPRDLDCSALGCLCGPGSCVDRVPRAGLCCAFSFSFFLILSLDFHFTKQRMKPLASGAGNWGRGCSQSWKGIRAVSSTPSLQSRGNQGPERGEDWPGSHSTSGAGSDRSPGPLPMPSAPSAP